MFLPFKKNLRRQKTGRKAYRTGLLAETTAAFLLTLKGYQILGRRVRTPVGEIDLLARKSNTLVIVEVKARGDALGAAYALQGQQRQRLIQAAHAVSARYASHLPHVRFDVVLVHPLALPRHIVNAFEGT